MRAAVIVEGQPWTGPVDSDWESAARVRLRAPVPPDRWPCGPPACHQDVCTLHTGGLFCDCDCSATDASDVEWGVG